MFSDIVGYAGLMGESERRGLLARSQHREIVAPIVNLHNGEVLETTADEILSIFSTVLDAIRAALLIETELETRADFRLHIPSDAPGLECDRAYSWAGRIAHV